MIDRPDGVEALRRKLLFRAGHRGFREMDMFMSAFAEAHLAAMDLAELRDFERVLDLPDQDVFGWITGRAAPSDAERSTMLDRVISFRYPAARTSV